MNILCFSHLKWDFVFQRPQHLMTRFARYRKIFFIEEPSYNRSENEYQISSPQKNIFVVNLNIVNSSDDPASTVALKQLLHKMISTMVEDEYICWYYSPMFLPLTDELDPSLVIYDCMDELSNFNFAHPEMKQMEMMLLEKCDLVFTGGKSLYRNKKHLHPAVYCFPSSIDKVHFATARNKIPEPQDQKDITGPRLGYFGVIDERIDLGLIKEISHKRPEWNIIMVGPVTKIPEQSLPRAHNIHYLGAKTYQELPSYLSGWDIALMPFALNDATKYISPTKTPEYLAAYKPVISTPIVDVIISYGLKGLVSIANNADEFISSAEKFFANGISDEWKRSVDFNLSKTSWELTYRIMSELMHQKLLHKKFLISKYAYG